jgi:hypothetical protein
MVTEFKERDWTQFFSYLDQLRESGVTNMLGSALYLQGAFELDNKEAKQILTTWMKTFNKNETPEERARRVA